MFCEVYELIALFKKFLSEQFIASVEVSNIARCSSKPNELRDIDSIGLLVNKAKAVDTKGDFTYEIGNFPSADGDDLCYFSCRVHISQLISPARVC